MHHGYDDLRWEEWSEGWKRATVLLLRGDTAWNPASTKGVIYGPATVTYERGPDGGVTAIVD